VDNPRPGRCTEGKRRGVHCTRGRLDLTASLDRCRKSRPHRLSIPGAFSLRPDAILTSLSWPLTNFMVQEFPYITILNQPVKTLLAVVHPQTQDSYSPVQPETLGGPLRYPFYICAYRLT
jgi:hypothetical protein